LGGKDLERIHPVYRYCVDFCKAKKIKNHFREDSGSFETLVCINHDGICRTYHEKSNYDFVTFVPDIIDYQNRIIIEIEEESKPKTGFFGAKNKKRGHWEEAKHDVERDEAYNLAGFKLHKVWESEIKTNSWRKKLHQFLEESLKV